MNHHNHSGKLNIDYLCTYSNIKTLDKTKVKGFKLVLDRIENFYSVGTGLYRYKKGRVKRRNTDYSNLYKKYEDGKYYCEEMNDKTAIFLSIEDLNKFYPDSKNDDKVCIVEIELTKDLIGAVVENQFHKCKICAGEEILSIKRYK